MRGDWKSEAMEYRDIDLAAQRDAEAAIAADDAKLDAMLRRDWLILEAHGQFCGCSAHAWMKILDDMTREAK